MIPYVKFACGRMLLPEPALEEGYVAPEHYIYHHDCGSATPISESGLALFKVGLYPLRCRCGQMLGGSDR